MVSKFLHPHSPVGYFSLIIEFTIKNWLTKEMVPRKTPTDMSFSLCFMFFILTVKIVFMFMSYLFSNKKHNNEYTYITPKYLLKNNNRVVRCCIIICPNTRDTYIWAFVTLTPLAIARMSPFNLFAVAQVTSIFLCRHQRSKCL
jgi:hypothetical protein